MSWLTKHTFYPGYALEIPETFAGYHAVQYVLLMCAVQKAYPTACRRSELGISIC
jgi:hypothetical protein